MANLSAEMTINVFNSVNPISSVNKKIKDHIVILKVVNAWNVMIMMIVEIKVIQEITVHQLITVNHVHLDYVMFNVVTISINPKKNGAHILVLIV